MKNGKFETQKEIFEALLRGERITCTEVLNQYYYLHSLGFISTAKGKKVSLCLDVPCNWSIYQEPKKKIKKKMYQFILKEKDQRAKIDEHLYESLQDFSTNTLCYVGDIVGEIIHEIEVEI